MQYGVLVDFFEVHGIFPNVIITNTSPAISMDWVDEKYHYVCETHETWHAGGFTNDKTKARTEAIKKANELFNKKFEL